MTEKAKSRAELRITPEDARSIASLLRYAISLNTTAGLVSPTQRRLATSTYRAVELAALVLEGKPMDEAIRVIATLREGWEGIGAHPAGSGGGA